MKIRCIICGKPISSELPNDTIFRGTATCPECEEHQGEGVWFVLHMKR
jgi:hypothetical protein